MDVFCIKWVSPHSFTTAVGRQLPPSIQILKVYPIALTLPSLQSQVQYAEYRVEVETEEGRQDIAAALTGLISAEHLPWQHQRDTGPRSYDLRALIDDLWIIAWHNGHCTIGMRLRCSSSGSGRPEQVTAALGFSHHPLSIHRTRLILETA
jgi:radical SAM-linked protein